MPSRKLLKYRAMRDVNRTAAPSGADAVGSSGRARDRPTRGTGRRRARQSTPGTGPMLGVTITNPAKALWPNAGDGRPVTKREFAQARAGLEPAMFIIRTALALLPAIERLAGARTMAQRQRA